MKHLKLIARTKPFPAVPARAAVVTRDGKGEKKLDPPLTFTMTL